MNVLSFNLKGGCGKTTLVVNTAVRAEEQGERALVLDADPQKNSSRFLSRYAKREYNTGTSFQVGCVSVTGELEAVQTAGNSLVLIDAPPDYRFIESFGRDFGIDVLLIPIDGSWAADGSIEVLEQIQRISPATRVFLWYNKSYDSKFSRAELRQIAEELGMVSLFRHPIPASENFKRSESLSVPVWRVPYASRSLATTNLTILTDWIINGCDDSEVLAVDDIDGRAEFGAYQSKRVRA